MARYNDDERIEPRWALWQPGERPIRFRVLAVARRARFGRLDYLIRPDSGDGARWVSEPSLEFEEAEGG